MTSRTRYVLLGAVGLALAVAVGLLVALVLRGITASSAPSAAPTASATAPPAPAAPAEPEAPPVPAPAAPRPEAGPNECVDELGDAGLDLDSARLELQDDDLAVQFQLAGQLPQGDSGVGLVAERNGGKAYQLGVALVDGAVDEVFVRDFDRSDQYDVDPDAVTVNGSTITVVFPEDAIKRLGNNWRWYAFATAPGAALDACPGTESDPQFLDLER